MRKKSKSEFTSQANKIHNYTYNYEKTLYSGANTKITIICLLHGEFYQTPNEHLKGYGCSKCGGTKRKSLEEFIVESNIIHNNKYNYNNSIYINTNKEITIICQVHGSFSQLPKVHLRGKGCSKCNGGVLDNIFDFIKKAEVTHQNKYNYSKSVYLNSKTKVEIICNTHGSFFQIPNDHIQGSNCPKCTRLGRTSKIESQWLDSLLIPLQYRNFQIKINKKLFYVDGFDPSTNTIYEFYGDFWHGNPKIYKSTDVNYINSKTYGELYSKTIDRQKSLNDAGYKIIYIWENEFKGNNVRMH